MDSTTRTPLGDYTGKLRRASCSSPARTTPGCSPGIPPGPIGNPGEAALKAVLTRRRATGRSSSTCPRRTRPSSPLDQRVQPARRSSWPVETGGRLRWAAVLGSPIAHSLSPVLHRAAYAALGLDWLELRRARVHAERPARLLRRPRADPAFGGFSLTMPLKLAALPLLDELEPLARTGRGGQHRRSARTAACSGPTPTFPGWSPRCSRPASPTRPRPVVLGAGVRRRPRWRPSPLMGEPRSASPLRDPATGPPPCLVWPNGSASVPRVVAWDRRRPAVPTSSSARSRRRAVSRSPRMEAGPGRPALRPCLRALADPAAAAAQRAGVRSSVGWTCWCIRPSGRCA